MRAGSAAARKKRDPGAVRRSVLKRQKQYPMSVGGAFPDESDRRSPIVDTINKPDCESLSGVVHRADTLPRRRGEKERRAGGRKRDEMRERDQNGYTYYTRVSVQREGRGRGRGGGQDPLG